MSDRIVHWALAGVLALTGLVGLGWWIRHNPVQHLVEHVPGMDDRPKFASDKGHEVAIGAYFERFAGVASPVEGSWPRFRGADFNNISGERVPLARGWDGRDPPLLWSVDLGEGHAGPVVDNGRVFVLDYDEALRADMLRCFSLDDGREIWRRGYDVYIKRNHGVSRTVPAVSDNRVLTIGPKCHVMCVAADSGEFQWGLDLVETFGAEIPLWYTGQCPLIDGSVAVIAVGGDALLMGVQMETGEILWETPNRHDWKMSHSSVMPYSVYGKKMYLYCAIGGIVGISAENGEEGTVLFESKLWDRNVIAPSPIDVGEGKIFVTAGYGGGSMMLQLVPEGGRFAVESLQILKPDEGLASEQQTPIFHQNHLFAIMPKDAGPLRNQFVCVRADDCSKVVWSSGKTERFGLGPYLIADGKFFILSDEGMLTVLEVSTEDYRPLAKAQILDGHDAWAPMALVQGRLLARDSRRMVCLDISAQ
ncbi:MAG: PQQ-binding-like beta-propeller repeat protein [Gemmatimonadetes bacterium]|nr:PQQ-binding-like beta-propeller repeat protein [Gemmatimonadota bacterium]